MTYDVKKAIAEVKKRFGEESVVTFLPEERDHIDVISTGSMALDLAIGVGGIPRGRISEIYGPESSGKTTVCLHACADANRRGLPVGYIDMEQDFALDYARALGVAVDNPDLFLLSQPDSGEEALSIAEAWASNGIPLIVVDSVAALVTTQEIEKDMIDPTVGSLARLMSKGLRKLRPIVQRNNVALLFTNQIRMKIGVMYGNPETTPGGNALKFAASVRLDIRPRAMIKDGKEIIGRETEVRVIKNKVAPPFKSAKFEIRYGKGIESWLEIIQLGVSCGAVAQKGAWFYYNDEKIGQGMAMAKEWLQEHPDETSKIVELIRANAHLESFQPAPDEGES